MQVKTCTKCLVEQPESSFNRRADSGILKGTCKSCGKAYLRQHYEANLDYYKGKSKAHKKANPEATSQGQSKYRKENREKINAQTYAYRKAYPERRKSSQLKGKYGITHEEYVRISGLQGHVCAGCKQPETRKHQSGEVKALAVDHCHTTQEIRGLLCADCNMALGLLKDNLQTFANLSHHLLGTARENYPDDVKLIMTRRVKLENS